MKKYTLIFLISIAGGVLFSLILKGVSGGLSLVPGWSGMLYLDRMGWPLSWRTDCSSSHGPVSPEGFQVPTGCMDGFNPIAFGLNILFFSVILFLLTVIVRKYLKKKK